MPWLAVAVLAQYQSDLDCSTCAQLQVVVGVNLATNISCSSSYYKKTEIKQNPSLRKCQENAFTNDKITTNVILFHCHSLSVLGKP